LQRIISLTLAGFACAALAIVTAQSNTQSKQKTTSKTAAKSTAAKTSKTKGKSAAVAYRPKQLQPTPQRYREIQQALLDRGYFEGPVDGVWGVSSTDALKKFQRDQNLVDDGKISSLSLIGLGLGPQRAAFSPKPAAAPENATPGAPAQP
jgi:peptidoglycan hydrolase-like protein with peptidoglycan-binding domain